MNALDYAQKASKIFVLSDSFIRIKELVDSEQSTLDDIAEVITLDPALASTVLKLANSSFFNYPGKIDTISKAVLILGITEVYNLVIAYFTTEAFSSISADMTYLDRFWENSVDCALMVKFIGNTMAIKNAERLFILGLLHNIGELVVQQFNPDAVEECNNHSLDCLPWQKQQKVLGFTFADVTAAMLMLWHLPVSITTPIRQQNSDDFDALPTDSQLLYIAKRSMVQCYYYDREAINRFIAQEILDEKQLTQKQIEQAYGYCSLEKFAIINLLNPGSSTIY